MLKNYLAALRQLSDLIAKNDYEEDEFEEFISSRDK
jgi:hypothetical protein